MEQGQENKVKQYGFHFLKRSKKMKAFNCPVCNKKFELKNWVYNNRKKKNPNAVICCSRSCANRLKTGETAPNWKGGVSKNQYSRYRKHVPHKYKAQNAVERAIKVGKLKKPEKCTKCKQIKKVEAHHKNYNKQLDVIWLCHRCHMGEHYGKGI